MRRVLSMVLMVLMLLLAACGTAGVAVPAAQPADDGPEATQASDAGTVEESPPVAGDTITPAETPQEAGAIRARDWTKGTDEPVVTIIEYGDFQ